MKMPQAPEHRKELCRLSYLLTQVLRPAVGLAHFWRRPAFGDTQRCAKGKAQGKFVPSAFPRIWEGHEHVQSLAQMCHCLHMRRALNGALPGALPIGYGRLVASGFGVMVRNEFRMRLGGLRKLFDEHASRTLVVVLPGAAQQ